MMSDERFDETVGGCRTVRQRSALYGPIGRSSASGKLLHRRLSAYARDGTPVHGAPD